jgi:uncharacterized pyridoxamine 5'-phosphate oxidase family protein
MRLILLFLSFLILLNFNYSFVSPHPHTIKFVYIPDLNLYPTPASNIRTKSKLEKEKGLLFHESQAVFQDLISYVNLKINPDFVVFGGNNVADFSSSVSDDLLQLLLDMASQIKASFFIVSGGNEMKSKSANDLVRVIKSTGVNSSETWWMYAVPENNLIFVGLNSSLFFVSASESVKQLNWLSKLLAENKNKNVVLFMHDSIVQTDGKIISNKYALKLYKLIKQNPNIRLVASGNTSANRLKLSGKTVFALTSSILAYPCTFRIFEISDKSLSVRTVKIPLKGIIKKAEKYLIESDFAKSIPQSSEKSIKTYAEGKKVDNEYSLNFPL